MLGILTIELLHNERVEFLCCDVVRLEFEYLSMVQNIGIFVCGDACNAFNLTYSVYSTATLSGSP